MKGKSIIKKLTLFSSVMTLLFVLSSSNIKKHNKNGFHIVAKVSKNKIEYSRGTIYIGNNVYLKSINDLKENDVLVLDCREDNDPNVKVYDSYKITSPELIEEIVDGLLLYEEVYPSPWRRSRNSLIREWNAHNIVYQLGLNHDSTTDVDLNNADEKNYRLRKIFALK